MGCLLPLLLLSAIAVLRLPQAIIRMFIRILENRAVQLSDSCICADHPPALSVVEKGIECWTIKWPH